MSHVITPSFPTEDSLYLCFSCKVERPLSQLSACPDCRALICAIGRCTATCKCNNLPAPEILLQDDNLRANFCIHSEIKCFGCFMRSKYITFLKEANGRYLHISGAFFECFGVNPGRLINHTSYECFDYEMAREFEDGDRCAVTTGQTDTRIVNWSHADGRKMLWMIKKSVIKNGLILGVAFDITAYMANHSSGDLLPPMDLTHTKMVESSLRSYAA